MITNLKVLRRTRSRKGAQRLRCAEGTGKLWTRARRAHLLGIRPRRVEGPAIACRELLARVRGVLYNNSAYVTCGRAANRDGCRKNRAAGRWTMRWRWQQRRRQRRDGGGGVTTAAFVRRAAGRRAERRSTAEIGTSAAAAAVAQCRRHGVDVPTTAVLQLRKCCYYK